MRQHLASSEKPLHWIGSSYRDLLRFPEAVRRSIGFALGAAQHGGKHSSAKPWKGEGPGVLEVVKDFSGDTYRAVYTVPIRASGLRPARFSKEVAGRNCDATIGRGTDPQPAARRSERLRGEIWLKKGEKVS
jgi:Phage derived protein Gp49-like (DUF891)